MNKKRVLVNIISSGIQVLIVGIVYFFLYRFLLTQLNVKLLGVWSVVLATSSLANLANFGVSSSVVRHVAIYNRDGDSKKLRSLIFTSSNFLLVLFCLLSLIIYPFASLILKGIIGSQYLNVALEILPYSIACLIINEVGGVYASVLDGLQLNYVRSIIFTISTVILLALSYWLTPLYGLKGVAYAQVIQTIFTFITCLMLLVLRTKYNPLKLNWSKSIFKEIFSYGMKFQFLSITAMLCDPVTKTLLTKFGGLNFTGYYEMAGRLVNQVKGAIVNANQSLVPVLIHQSNNDGMGKKVDLYKINMVAVFYFSLFVFSMLIIFSGFISTIWIGSQVPFFLDCVMLLCLGAFVNLHCNPAYFSNIASGKLNTLIYSQIIMALGNLIFGFVGGYLFGAMGVVWGWILASALGSIYLIRIYHKQNELKFSNIFNEESFMLFLGVFSLLLIRYMLIRNNNEIILNCSLFIAFLVMFAVAVHRVYKNKEVYFNL